MGAQPPEWAKIVTRLSMFFLLLPCGLTLAFIKFGGSPALMAVRLGGVCLVVGFLLSIIANKAAGKGFSYTTFIYVLLAAFALAVVGPVLQAAGPG